MNPEITITGPSWLDLWRYIQTADVNDTGIHVVDDETDLHIYDHKWQCNLDVLGETISSIAIVFQNPNSAKEPADVWLVPVSNTGIAAYDHANLTVPTTEVIAITAMDGNYRNVAEVRSKLIDMLLPKPTVGYATTQGVLLDQVDPKVELQNGYENLIEICMGTIEQTKALTNMVQESIRKVRAYRDSDDANNTTETLYQLQKLNSLLTDIRRLNDNVLRSLDRAERETDNIAAKE